MRPHRTALQYCVFDAREQLAISLFTTAKHCTLPYYNAATDVDATAGGIVFTLPRAQAARILRAARKDPDTVIWRRTTLQSPDYCNKYCK